MGRLVNVLLCCCFCVCVCVGKGGALILWYFESKSAKDLFFVCDSLIVYVFITELKDSNMEVAQTLRKS